MSVNRRPQGVAVLIDSLAAGGAERVAVEHAAQLDRDRFRPHIVVTRAGGPLENRARALGVHVTVIGRQRMFSPRQFLRILRLVRSCDVVHAHKLAGGSWGVLFGSIARRPVVVHEHTSYGGATHRARLLYRWWIGRLATRVVCVSEDVAAHVCRLGVPAEKVIVVPNAVTTQGHMTRAEARQALRLDPSEFVIGIVGRLRTEKRHDLLLHALAHLRSEIKVLLCVIGDGPRREMLESLADRLGVGDSVVWIGERTDAPALYAAFDITVLCSDFEGLPLAALESLAAGVPVVATEVGGLPALLRDGGGVLVPAGDSVSLADALNRLIDDATLREELGSSGQVSVMAKNSPEAATALLEGVLDEARA